MSKDNQRLTFGVYVPVPGSRTDSRITPGSGIVGRPHDCRIHLHYEGNLYGASNLHDIHTRLLCAWGRLKDRYPTVAQTMVDESEVVKIGEFDGTTVTFSSGEAQRVFNDYADRYKAN